MTNNNLSPSASPQREIGGKRTFSYKRFFLQWEWLLVALLIVINVVNASLSPNYLSYNGIMSALRDFMDKAVMVFPMIMIILLGEIDISIGSTMALCATIIGVSYQAGVPMGGAIIIGLIIGAACGFFNGYLIAKFKELSAVIVTLSTMIIYRGIATIILEDGSAGGFPMWFTNIAWGDAGGIPYTVLFFIVEIVFFTLLLHKTKFGRKVFAMGNNEETSRYSGIKTQRIRIIIYTIMGLFAAVAAIILMSKMGSARPNVAKGYELDVIAMVVLGGVSTAGGKGRVFGCVLSIFVVCLLRYGLGIINVPSQTIMIILGALLIIAVAVPNLKGIFSGYGKNKKLIRKN